MVQSITRLDLRIRLFLFDEENLHSVIRGLDERDGI